MNNIKDLKGFEGLYAGTIDGHIYSYCKGGLKSERLSREGYYEVTLNKNGKAKRYKVHRLIAQAFIGEIPKGYCVNHKDECKTNNAVDNLEIVTIGYNTTYGTACERRGLSNRKAIKLTSLEDDEELYFTCSEEASDYFGLKFYNSVSTLIWKAKKKGMKYIIINDKPYLF